MKMRIIVFVFLSLVFTAGQNTFAQMDYGFDFSKSGSAGLQSLKIGVGAKETALGEAVSSIVNDANSVFWNASGIAFIEKYQVAFSHNQWIQNSAQNSAVLAFPYNSFVFAVSASSFAIKDFEETTALEPEGTGRMVSAGDYLFGIAAARRFTDRLAIGVQVKYINEKLDDYNIGNVLFDVGAIYSTGFRDLTLGFSLQHFGPDMKLVDLDFRTPLLFRLSASDKQRVGNNLIFTAAAELVHPTDNSEVVNFGLSCRILDLLELRGGYRNNVDLSKFSFGFGIEPSIPGFGKAKLDYSYTPSELVFKDIQRFSISIEF